MCLRTFLSRFQLIICYIHSEWNSFQRSSFIFYMNDICCFFAHGASGRGHRTKIKIDLESADFGDSVGSLPYLTWTWFGFYSLIFRISLSQRFITQFFREKRSTPWWLLQYVIQNHSLKHYFCIQVLWDSLKRKKEIQTLLFWSLLKEARPSWLPYIWTHVKGKRGHTISFTVVPHPFFTL